MLIDRQKIIKKAREKTLWKASSSTLSIYSGARRTCRYTQATRSLKGISQLACRPQLRSYFLRPGKDRHPQSSPNVARLVQIRGLKRPSSPPSSSSQRKHSNLYIRIRLVARGYQICSRCRTYTFRSVRSRRPNGNTR